MDWTSYSRAVNYLASGRTDETIRICREELARVPGSFEFTRLLALALIEERRSEDVIGLLGPSPLTSAYSALCGLLAGAYTDQGDLGAGHELLEAALHRFPDNARLRADLAEIEIRQGNREAARDNLERALELESADAYLHCRLAEVLYELGDTSSAVKRWQMAVFINPHQTSARLSLGLVLGHQGDFEQSALHLRLSGPAAFVRYTLACACFLLEEVSEAENAWQSALDAHVKSGRSIPEAMERMGAIPVLRSSVYRLYLIACLRHQSGGHSDARALWLEAVALPRIRWITAFANATRRPCSPLP